MKPKIMITGGSGFIGESFIKSFFNMHFHAEIIISLRNNRTKYLSNKGCRIIQNNIENRFEFNERADILIHIASEKQKIDKMWSTNYLGTKNVVKWAIKSGIKKIIYISSIAVFGKNDNKTISESSRCMPMNTYARTKYAAEKLIRKDCINNNIQYLILRPSNVIDSQRLNAYPLLNFIRSINNGRFFYVKNQENVYLNYITIDNVVEILKSMVTTSLNKNAVYILNNPIRLNNLVRSIAQYLKVKEPKRVIPYNVGCQLATFGDVIQSFLNIPVPFNSNVLQELTNDKIYEDYLVKKEIVSNYSNNILQTITSLATRYREEGLI